MLEKLSARRRRKIRRVLSQLDTQTDHTPFTGILQADVEHLKTIFDKDDLIQYRRLESARGKFCLVYCDGLVDGALIDQHLIGPIMQAENALAAKPLLERVVQVSGAKEIETVQEAIDGLTYGDTLLLCDGMSPALLVSTKCFDGRAVSEPEGEKILSGPRDGFTEILMQNLSLVKRRLRTTRLKMRFETVGEKTKTKLCVAYLEGIVNPKVLDELYKRLAQIDIDGVLDANYITELIRDDAWSPFRSIGYTERPDVITAKLLEGRVALFVDGTPVVLTLPYLFIENFQSNEDYYLNFYYTTFSRLLRMAGFVLTIMVPAVYIAIVAYHQEMLPSTLLISIAIERHGVPLPAALEAFVMLAAFDILRETGLRMPTNVGQALGIVGALVIGQAAVEANLVAAPMIIVVAMTGITSLLIPKMNSPVLVLRFGMLALASCLGFFGIAIGSAALLAHMLDLRSFGVWQLTADRGFGYQDVKDTFIRAPWWQMKLRPEALAQSKVRQGEGEGRA